MVNYRKRNIVSAGAKKNSNSNENNGDLSDGVTFESKIQSLFMEEINKPVLGGDGRDGDTYNTLLMKTCEYICIEQTKTTDSGGGSDAGNSNAGRGKGASNTSARNKKSNKKNKDKYPFEDVIIAFLKAGADPNLVDCEMNSAISIAFRLNCENIALLFLDNSFFPVNSSTNAGLAVKVLDDGYATSVSAAVSSSSSDTPGSGNRSINALKQHLVALLNHDAGWCTSTVGVMVGVGVGAAKKKKIKQPGLLQSAAKYGLYPIVEMLLQYTHEPKPTVEMCSSASPTPTRPSSRPVSVSVSALGLEMLHHVDDCQRTALEMVEAAYLANHFDILKSYSIEKAGQPDRMMCELFVKQENVSTLLKYVGVDAKQFVESGAGSMGDGGGNEHYGSGGTGPGTNGSGEGESEHERLQRIYGYEDDEELADLDSDSDSDSDSESSDGYGSYEEDDSQYESETETETESGSESESEYSRYSVDRQRDETHALLVSKLGHSKVNKDDGFSSESESKLSEEQKWVVSAEERQELVRKQAELLKVLMRLVECIGIREAFGGLTYADADAVAAVENTNKLHTALVKVMVLVSLGGLGCVLNTHFSANFELYTDRYKCCSTELKPKYHFRPGSKPTMDESLDFSDPAFDNEKSGAQRSTSTTAADVIDDFYNDDKPQWPVTDSGEAETGSRDQETYYMLPAIHLMRGVAEFYHALQLCCLLTHNLPRADTGVSDSMKECHRSRDYCGYYLVLLEMWNNLWGTVSSLDRQGGCVAMLSGGVSDPDPLSTQSESVVSAGLQAVSELHTASDGPSGPSSFEFFNERSVHFLFYILCGLHPTVSPEDVHTWSVIISELVLESSFSSSSDTSLSVIVTSGTVAGTWSSVLGCPAIAAYILNSMTNIGRNILFGTSQQIYEEGHCSRGESMIKDKLLFQAHLELFLRLVVPRLPVVYDNCRVLEAPTRAACVEMGIQEVYFPKLSQITDSNSLLKAVTGYLCPEILDMWGMVDLNLSFVMQPLEEGSLSRIGCMLQSLYVWALVDGNTYHPRYSSGPGAVAAALGTVKGAGSSKNKHNFNRDKPKKKSGPAVTPSVFTDCSSFSRQCLSDTFNEARWELNRIMCDSSVDIEPFSLQRRMEYIAAVETVCNSSLLQAGRYLGSVSCPVESIHFAKAAEGAKAGLDMQQWDLELDLSYTTLCPEAMVVGWEVFSQALSITSMPTQQALRSLSITMESFNVACGCLSGMFVNNEAISGKCVKYPFYAFEVMDLLACHAMECVENSSQNHRHLQSGSVVLSGGGCIRVSSADSGISHDKTVLGSFGPTSDGRLLTQYPYTFVNCITGSYVGTYLLKHRGLLVPSWFWDIVVDRQVALDCIFESNNERSAGTGLDLGFFSHMRALDASTLPISINSSKTLNNRYQSLSSSSHSNSKPTDALSLGSNSNLGVNPGLGLNLTVHNTYRWDSQACEEALLFASDRLRERGELLEEMGRSEFRGRLFDFDMLHTYSDQVRYERNRRERNNSLRIKTNRFEEPAVWVNSIINQFLVPDLYLAYRDFDVSYNKEAGTGPGPVREFFEMCVSVLFGVNNVNSGSGPGSDTVCVTAAEKRLDEAVTAVAAMRVSTSSSSEVTRRNKSQDTVCNTIAEPEIDCNHKKGKAQSSKPKLSGSDNVEKQEIHYCDIFPVFQPGNSTHPNAILPRSIGDIEEDFWYRTGLNRMDAALRTVLKSKIRDIFEVCGIVIGLAAVGTENIGLNMPVIVWDNLVVGPDVRLEESRDILHLIHDCIKLKESEKSTKQKQTQIQKLKASEEPEPESQSQPQHDSDCKPHSIPKPGPNKNKTLLIPTPTAASECRYSELNTDLDESVQLCIRSCGGSDLGLKRSCDQILRMEGNEINSLELTFNGIRSKWTCRPDATGGYVSTGYRLVSVPIALCRNNKKAVTNINKFEYMHLKLKMHCMGDTHNSMNHIRRGLVRVIPQHLLCLIEPSYLQKMLCGDRTTYVDIGLLKKHVIYEAPYKATHPVVIMFWKLLQESFNNTNTTRPNTNPDSVLSHGVSNNSREPNPSTQLKTLNPSRDANEARLRKLILFWTGSSSLPVDGYHINGHDLVTSDQSEYEPMIIGRMTPLPSKKNRSSHGTNGNSNGPSPLPTASTCDKTLRIPEYATAEEMLVGLNAAIEYGCIGFDKA